MPLADWRFATATRAPAAPAPRRDIKSPNILLTAEGRAKISDVGAAAIANCGWLTAGTSFAGTASAAPEALPALVGGEKRSRA